MHTFPFPCRQIGDYQVTALSDGEMAANLALLAGIACQDAEQLQAAAGITQPGNIHINCYLIRGRGRVILVDSGTGGLNNAGGLLKQNLARAGVTPDEVDTVLLTHAHPDHIGGLLDADGLQVYRQAELYLHPLEAEFWRDNDRFQQANERQQRTFLLVRRTLDAYASNLRFFDHCQAIAGIFPVWLPGHTPGHTGFRIDSPDGSLLIWGDIVHYPHIQSARPAVSIAFDNHPLQAQQTREKILALAAQEKLLVAGMHFAGPGFAHILAAADGGYRIAYSEE